MGKKLKFIVFTIALLSTKSTTGYLVFGLLMVLFVVRNRHLSLGKKVLMLMVIATVFAYEYSSLDFLQDKLAYETSTSEKDQSRILDYLYFKNAIKENFIFGSGAQVVSSGNGFVAFLLWWGIIGLLYYFIAVYNTIHRYWKKDAVLFIAVIILCLQGEGFLSYPFFLGMPFIILNNNNDTFSLT